MPYLEKMNTVLVETFSDNLVIIPTYNEIENIESIIRVTLLQAHHFDVLLINEDVGSSITIIRAENETAFTISTSIQSL